MARNSSRDANDEDALRRAVEETAAKFGGLHYAFNNVGVSQRGAALTDLKMSDYDEQMDGNVRCTFLAMKHEGKLMTEDGTVHHSATRTLVAAAHGREFTFHRAIDVCADPFAALGVLGGFGVRRVLTSGAAPMALPSR